MEKDVVVEIVGLKKQYRLGTIGGGTLAGDLKRAIARKRGKSDPLAKIGEDDSFQNFGDSFYALDDINLTVRKGEAVGIIGHNGAGKSTLLKILSRVTVPTEGTVKLRGRVASMLEVGTGFHPELTGRENIYMNGAILGMSRAEVDEKLESIIDFSECKEFIDTPVKRYSSGMYVKLAFAVASHLDAEIMIMDEVLAVGDVKFQKKCLGKMDGDAHNEGKTVLYVSHNMATIRQLCTRCIVLEHGRVIYDGEVERAIELYSSVNNGLSQSFIDLSESKRPTLDHGSKFCIRSISFNKDVPIYYSDEPIDFSVSWKSEIELQDVYFRFEVANMDDTPVGMAQSECLGIVEENTEGVWRLSWDASNIVAGKYKIILDAYIMNEFGTFYSYDHPIDYIIIEIVQSGSNSMMWFRKSWNSVKLNSILIR